MGENRNNTMDITTGKRLGMGCG